MSNDEYVYFDERTHPVLPEGLDMLRYEAGSAASEHAMSRARFIAGTAGGIAALAGAGALARGASAASAQLSSKPLTGLAAQGILAWNTAVEPTQLNPIGVANDPSIRFPTLWNSSSLFRFSNRTRGVEFDLAHAFNAARDGSKWDIFLRPNVTWHDGTPLTAADVAATYNAVITPSVGSVWAGFTSYLGSAEALDNLTVRFHMKSTATWWIYTMAAIPIVQAAQVQNPSALATNPVGTGPFALSQWNRGQNMVFTPNTKFYGDTSNKFKSGLPKVKGLQYVIVPDVNTQVINLINGQCALTAAITPAQALGLNAHHGIKIYQAANTPNRVYYRLPMEPTYSLAPAPAGSKPRPEWADVNNRKALAYALDRETIVKVAFAGKAIPATSALGAGTLYYNPKIKGYGPKADVALAKRFLAAANPQIQRPLDLIVASSAGQAALDAVTIMQSNWQAIGIDVNINITDATTVSVMGKAQNYDMWVLNTVTGPSGGRSPNSWLFSITPNTTYFNLRNAPANFPSLISTINTSLDDKQVQAAMNQVQQIEIDQCCDVGVVYPNYFEAQGVPLSNYGVLNLGYLPYKVEDAQIV